jgi:hypothetical protein
VTTNHKDLTDPYLHEPKGAAAAGANEVYIADGAASGSFGRIPGSIVQVTEISDTTYSSLGSTILPHDDTVPLSTEGVQFLSGTHTALSATNKLHFHIYLSYGSIRFAGAGALFDSTTCIGAWGFPYIEASFVNQVGNVVTYVPGDTASHTYSVRAGTDNGNAVYMNGTSGGRLFGGKAETIMVIYEEEI